MKGLEAFSCHKTFLVGGEDCWSLELGVENTIAQHLLHHLLLGGKAICTTHIVRLLDFSNALTVLELRAFGSRSGVLVRCAIFRDEMAVLGKVRMEMRPSTFAAFSHVIAVEQELW